ncbi:MAG TPA: hypothetical protein VFN39_08845 [Gemmatimonadaceae bacterium]|nr:hypothetical protein [Gemmatimonadaceae bacterium]
MMKHAKLGLVVAVALALPAAIQAQNTKQPVKRRQQPIEIRGQVPTPQVVTVRPREVPTYSRQVLYPRFYDHDFWPSILPAYQLVTKRQMTGVVPVDSVTARADSAAANPSRVAAPAGTVPATPADSVRQQAPVARPDSVTPPPGTPPARTSL